MKKKWWHPPSPIQSKHTVNSQSHLVRYYLSSDIVVFFCSLRPHRVGFMNKQSLFSCQIQINAKINRAHDGSWSSSITTRVAIAFLHYWILPHLCIYKKRKFIPWRVIVKDKTNNNNCGWGKKDPPKPWYFLIWLLIWLSYFEHLMFSGCSIFFFSYLGLIIT